MKVHFDCDFVSIENGHMWVTFLRFAIDSMPLNLQSFANRIVRQVLRALVTVPGALVWNPCSFLRLRFGYLHHCAECSIRFNSSCRADPECIHYCLQPLWYVRQRILRV